MGYKLGVLTLPLPLQEEHGKKTPREEGEIRTGAAHSGSLLGRFTVPQMSVKGQRWMLEAGGVLPLPH